MKILLSGASGFIGSALTAELRSAGHSVTPLVRTRRHDSSDGIPWQPELGILNSSVLHGFDGVIHLAGENIAARRWTPAQKERIRRSRTQGTALLVQTLMELPEPPAWFLSASAIGFYGDRGDEILDETSPAGTGFLPEVSLAWESTSCPALQKGIRVAHLRFGIVLSRDGGALAKMIPPFRLGLGGRMGQGRQYMSWITLDDAVRAIIHIAERADLEGPFNLVSPQPVTNAEFTRNLGAVLHRPVLFPVPAVAIRCLLGEMANALLLASSRVLPKRLIESGFQFRNPDLKSALQSLLAGEG